MTVTAENDASQRRIEEKETDGDHTSFIKRTENE